MLYLAPCPGSSLAPAEPRWRQRPRWPCTCTAPGLWAQTKLVSNVDHDVCAADTLKSRCKNLYNVLKHNDEVYISTVHTSKPSVAFCAMNLIEIASHVSQFMLNRHTKCSNGLTMTMILNWFKYLTFGCPRYSHPAGASEKKKSDWRIGRLSVIEVIRRLSEVFRRFTGYQKFSEGYQY